MIGIIQNIYRHANNTHMCSYNFTLCYKTKYMKGKLAYIAFQKHTEQQKKKKNEFGKRFVT